jgi:oligopeptide/dipeptide ABC transporter ATP-binding protein
MAGAAANEYLLDIQDLDVSFEQQQGRAHALRGVNLCLRASETHALVGESGSGKTVTSMCTLGLLASPPGRVNRGQVIFQNRDLLQLSENERRKVRGKDIGMIFQEPGKYLNPAYKIGEQITESLILHFQMEKRAAVEKALELLNLVGLGKNRRVLNSYPHELSGGMKQRAMIAMAIACHPALLIADEPTTALDVTLQLQILRLILKLKDKFAMGVLFISHDLGVVKEIADRISVIYAGKIIESAAKNQLFESPLHPYTKLLLLSIPDAAKRGERLRAIPGSVPDGEHIPAGCSFHPRCPLAEDICRTEIPPDIEYDDGHKAACYLIGKKWIDS